MNRTLALIIVIIFVIAVWIGVTISIGFPYALILGSSATLGLIGWLLTTYKKPADPKVIYPPYFLVLAGYFLHMIEEYYYKFPLLFNHYFGTHATMMTLQLTMQVMPILAVIAAWGLLYKNHLANYFAWFVLAGPGFVELSHYIFPLLVPGPYRYFPGMMTAFIPVIFGMWGMIRLFKFSRSEQRSDHLYK